MTLKFDNASRPGSDDREAAMARVNRAALGGPPRRSQGLVMAFYNRPTHPGHGNAMASTPSRVLEA